MGTIHGGMEIDATCTDTMELENFPFDIQDFPIMLELNIPLRKAILVPQYGVKNFCILRRDCISAPEWDILKPVVEFANSAKHKSRSNTVYSQLLVRMKARRLAGGYLWRLCLFMSLISLCALTMFGMKTDEVGGRLQHGFTLLLTAVAFQFVVSQSLPNIPYLTVLDKYVICIFCYMLAVASWPALQV